MATIKEFLNKKRRADTFIQIGTNDGCDRFRNIVREYKPKLVVLIEPNKDLIPEIENNYSGIANVCIENVAIATEEKDVSLYIPLVDGNGRADNGCYYSSSTFSMIPMNDWGSMDNMEKITAKAVTLSSIFRKYGIRKADYLCTDTEGYDAEILKNTDLWKYQIDILQYEKWDFDSSVFARHNPNWEQLGSAGMDTLHGILSLMGYDFYDDSDDGNNIIAVTKRAEVWI